MRAEESKHLCHISVREVLRACQALFACCCRRREGGREQGCSCLDNWEKSQSPILGFHPSSLSSTHKLSCDFFLLAQGRTFCGKEQRLGGSEPGEGKEFHHCPEIPPAFLGPSQTCTSVLPLNKLGFDWLPRTLSTHCDSSVCLSLCSCSSL